MFNLWRGVLDMMGSVTGVYSTETFLGQGKHSEQDQDCTGQNNIFDTWFFYTIQLSTKNVMTSRGLQNDAVGRGLLWTWLCGITNHSMIAPQEEYRTATGSGPCGGVCDHVQLGLKVKCGVEYTSVKILLVIVPKTFIYLLP